MGVFPTSNIPAAIRRPLYLTSMILLSNVLLVVSINIPASVGFVLNFTALLYFLYSPSISRVSSNLWQLTMKALFVEISFVFRLDRFTLFTLYLSHLTGCSSSLSRQVRSNVYNMV